MIRRVTGYALLAIIGMAMLKILFSLIGLAVSLVATLVWLAAVGLVLYLILKIINPEAARRIRERITGHAEGEE